MWRKPVQWVIPPGLEMLPELRIDLGSETHLQSIPLESMLREQCHKIDGPDLPSLPKVTGQCRTPRVLPLFHRDRYRCTQHPWNSRVRLENKLCRSGNLSPLW